MDDMNEKYIFTCKECGSHRLRIKWQYSVITNRVEELECDCGKTKDGVAACREIETTDTYEAWDYLSEDHRLMGEDKEEELDSDDEINFEVFCTDCYEGAEQNDWKITNKESEKDDDSYEFYVYCDGCNREIEFGRSHADGGRFWPAECIDFNPLRCFPDNRYKEDWAKKFGLDR